MLDWKVGNFDQRALLKMLTGLIFLQLLTLVNCVTPEDFFPFGEAVGDEKLPNKRNAFGKVLNLNATYSFYNKGYNVLQVHGEGLITFGNKTSSHATLRHRKFPFPPSAPSVAVFYAPIQVENLSEVFYRVTTNQSFLELATGHVRSSFAKEGNFAATEVFIVTWNNVTHADNRFPNEVNTFQVVLITDGRNTFSLFNYKDDGLQWIKGYPVRYQGRRLFDAQVGFSAGDQVRYYLLPGSGTKDVKRLTTKSNVMHPGQWVYKIGWPSMAALNVKAADSYFQTDSHRPLYVIVEQYFSGCFKVHGYLSSNASKIWKDVSIRSCMILCNERNYRYAALHDGNQCACMGEPEYTGLEKLPKEACNVPCAINDDGLCGGKTAASVFWAVGGSILSDDERTAGLNDVDECDSGVSQCHSNATCKNTAPGYCCECNEDYYGNGIVCEKEGQNLRFNGRLSGNINGINFASLTLDLVAITKDGRVYAVIRRPPTGLTHALKILTPFANMIGWMLGVRKVKGVPNGLNVIGNRFTRSAAVSFDSGETLRLNQNFRGMDASGRFISMETTINGTMPSISADANVRVDSFKEVYRREDPGRVESDGFVTFEVNGERNGFSVLQNIAYDELRGCDAGFYSFDVESRIVLTKYDAKQMYSLVAIRSFIVNASTPDTQGQQGNGNPCGPKKIICHSKASCVSDRGNEQCVCNDGYQGDGSRCEASRCSQECDPDATCTENSGSWQCACNLGFQGDGINCKPDGTCVGVQCNEHAQCLYIDSNSRKCVCNEGYQGDGRNCAPRDKCEGVRCGPNATCDATGKCSCDQGFQGDGQQCDDVDECKKSLDKCHSDADCTNNVGSYICRCKDGYLGNGFTCFKKEVSLLCGGQECHSQAQCSDDKCVCNRGYQGDGVTCADVNECLGDNECHAFADCTNTNGSYTCTCKDGYQGNGKECTKVDPTGGCSGQKCHVYAACLPDLDTGEDACGCRIGFVGDGLECKDLDECRVVVDICSDNKTKCVNTLGSFECLCKTGFMEVNGKCVSDDTCMGVDCDVNAACDPFRGCLCKPGYLGDGRSCEDEDECDPSRSPCDLNATCTNTVGSFLCQCKSGFTGDGLRCQRVDESSLEENCNGVVCDTHAQCVQPLDQPLQCECDKGWQGNGETCTDVNECENIVCHPLRAECINTEGSYECRCKPGFQGDGINCISDGSCHGVQCHENATCFKPTPEVPGLCICKDGWLGNGRQCYDVDECQDTSKNSCDENADCVNTDGSYKCRCKLGYQGDGLSCVSEDSCGGVLCDSNADCLLNGNRQICLCRNGWTGDGQTCYDVDECQPFKNNCHFDAECVNSAGSYECRCRPGYQGDGFNCTSDGTCEGVTCDSNADCNRTFPSGRRECICKPGWQGDGRVCSDVDECQPFKNNCSSNAGCVNTEGSYDCQCRPGFQGDGFNCLSDGSCEGIFCDPNADCLSSSPEETKQCKCRDGWLGDGRNCSDIDECQPSNNDCHVDAECFNTAGSYECRCRPGYRGNGLNCVSDGTCEGVTCDPNADCNRTFPLRRRLCICKPGWQGDGRRCFDIDECRPSKNNCHIDAQCVNTAGSYECRCRPGYQGDGFDCVSDGTCEAVICDPNADCNRTFPSGRRRCICKPGWQGGGRSCSDIDECRLPANSCHQKARCINTAGSFECRCRPGYLGNGFDCTSDGSCDGVVCNSNAFCRNTSVGDQRKCWCNNGWRGNGTHCSDINECESPANGCDVNADCFNIAGSYRCRCRLGYQGNGSHCVSDGTCDGVVCDQNSACVPRAVGSRERQCVCVDGWTGDGRSCADIDECQVVNSCHRHANCINTPGSFSCQCKLGYEGSGFDCKSDGTCAGVVCHANATCRNMIQGPTCVCKGGYEGDGTSCTDTDECQTGDNDCNSNADCLNSIGSYSCQCKPGYEGSGFICKSDGTCAGVRCHPDATCEEVSNLGPVCVCKPGYQGDGRKCSDIDECVTEDHNCHQEAECINTVGSHNCSCKLGFEGDGVSCKPDGTCAGIVCAVYAECVKSPSNASICECKTGFTGNGLDCRDIDECAQLTHECHRKATCVNQLGSYVCRCKPGYYGNGFNCSSDGTCEGVVCDYNADCVALDNSADPEKDCKCRVGFSGNGDICNDINECEDSSVCPDKADCYNMAGSFMCYCLPGYKMVGITCIKDCNQCLNGGSCTESSTCICPPGFTGKRCQWHGEASLVYSKGNSIQRMSLPPRPNNVGVIYQHAGAVHVGVDYDCVDQKVYWTEVMEGVIRRAKYDGSEVEVILNGGKTSSPEGIAVDWLGRNIYWTDSRLYAIQVAKLNGSQKRTLVSSNLGNPRAIIVDPPNGKMYWADWSRNQPKIEVANMDGSERRVLVKSPLSLPNGLTLVQSTNELCYADAGMWSISCVNLGDLTMRKVYQPAPYPFGITNFNRTLFWTDWKLGRIQRMGMNSRYPDKPLRSFMGSTGKIFDIKAVQPCGRTVKSYRNPCAVENRACLGLCLLKSKSHSCSCPDGLHLVKTDNITKCEEKCDSALGMVSGVIIDKQLSAHSAWNNNHQRYGASRARLFLDEWPQGWRGQQNDPSPWLQIDFLRIRTVTAIATQGYGDMYEQEWVKTYVIMTSYDGHRWNSYREAGRKRVFIGNADTSSVVRNNLKMPLRTRWLRIVPRSWRNHVGMRVEFYGC